MMEGEIDIRLPCDRGWVVEKTLISDCHMIEGEIVIRLRCDRGLVVENRKGWLVT